jgi:hypothetical protein
MNPPNLQGQAEILRSKPIFQRKAKCIRGHGELKRQLSIMIHIRSLPQ